MLCNIRYIIAKQFNDGNPILHTYSFFGKKEKRIDGKKGKRNKKGERNWENKLHKDEIIRNKIILFYNLFL